MEQKNKDKRLHARRANPDTITFSIIGSFSGKKEFLPAADLKAALIDKSDKGIGILTGIQLEPGMMLKFNEVKGTGIVMWTIDMGDRYRSGLKFV